MERILTLHVIDGSRLSFSVEAQGANSAARKLKLDKLMTSKHLVVEAEGEVMIFPVANIKYMSLATPESRGVRETLPSHAITGARLRS